MATNTALLTVKMDPKLKKQAQKVAADMGLTLSAIVNAKLREVVRDRYVSFSLPLEPNEKTRKSLEKIDRDIRAGKNLAGPFKNAAEAIAYLES